MPEVVKSVLVPYSSEEMFQLVSDVESYPAFLPWCAGASVRPLEDGSRLAQVQIAFKGLRQSFTTRNFHDHGERIEMTLHDGPFKALAGHWRFSPLTEAACKVGFELDYHFSSRLLERLVGPVFEHITVSMVDAFVQRAEAIYGKRL
ncbi:MAG: type II toxin-antitoxin system RatA family toxin [Betaproteobacteria bacterium]|nr:type II toxin-antitoxin system RatA family toxin [Betaproteobacteria bacterium]NBT74509.1 type II toxin-antitoxin system RatA family toxin [Betaproteobacteria bacterium]NBY13747.1 type II toxin-antitoxin system RatA family toxin [Betaproteobacteria bacterium]NCA16560.1 type II toxin-antitoxin system RatA family toxin [Betaproteobacteria bacterium]NDF04807.1 type II toxin-antitoxin system RatA family toxin [Betaproteobacteria bacterium]